MANDLFKTYDIKGLENVELKGKIGDICDGTKIFCKLELGNKCHIAINNSFIGKGTVRIGDSSSVAPNCVFYTSMPNFRLGAKNKFVTEHEPISGDIVIGRNCFIGAGCVIGCGVIIEEGTVIPPLTNIKPFTKYKREYVWR